MTIDSTIEADTLSVCSTPHNVIRLMNDSRWPWLIVLPQNSDATELHHLNESRKTAFLHDISTLSQLVQAHTRCTSVNIAMLGNVVSALHCHIVARHSDDPNWPKPVWGFGESVKYSEDKPSTLIDAIRTKFANAKV